MELNGWHWAGIFGAAGVGLWGVVRALRPSSSEEVTSPDVGDAVSDLSDQEALARVIASEAGGQSRIAQLAVGWCVRNEAERLSRSISSLVAPRGEYGPQGSGGRSFVSSARPATSKTRELAGLILGDLVGDPTGGATNFYSPRLLDRQYAAGEAKQSNQQRAEKYASKGYGEVVIPGMTDDFRFWRAPA